MDERIELVPHDPSWAAKFETEADLLKERLGNWAQFVSHVGSTAIPSIKAKPIIDIVIESKVYPPSKTVVELLESMSYALRGEAGVSGRVWFTKGSPRKFNLNWCPESGEVSQAQIRFRDALKLNSELARKYESLKVAAAGDLHIDSYEYADAKTDFVSKVVAE